MADVSSSFTVIKEISEGGLTKLYLTTTAETMDDGDTIAITMADYGMSTFQYVKGWIHTTLNSVLVAEDPTSAVSAGVLTLTIGGSTDNKARTYEVGGQ